MEHTQLLILHRVALARNVLVLNLSVSCNFTVEEGRETMGIIEQGTVSGTLPSKEAFVVHFPGYPSSIPRAIETLGGIQGITEASLLLSAETVFSC